MPTGLRRAGQYFRTFAQQDGSDAAFTRKEVQPAARHQIERFGLAGNLQQQCPHMRAGQDVACGRKRFDGIGGFYEKEILGPAAQLLDALRMERAIFQCLVIGPHPEQRLLSRCPDGKAGGEAACAPIPGIDLVQGSRGQPASQGPVQGRHAQGKGRPVGRKPITRQKMAQVLDFLHFVHVMF
jgi:hypothetical protein